MGNYNDLVGQRFGKLLVVKDYGRYSTNEIKWLCQCDCGNSRFVRTYHLKRGINCCVSCNYKDFTGKRIGRLTVIRRTEDQILKSGKTRIRWECQCDCGVKVYRTAYLLGRGNCCCKRCKAVIDKQNNSTGFKEISGIYWSSLRSQAMKRGLSFEVKIDQAWDLYEEQKRLCALSGMEINFARSKQHYLERGTTASLDRIDSSVGYVKGNVQWVHKLINRMKSNLSQENFINICAKVSQYKNAKTN